MATNPELFDEDIGDVTGPKGDTGKGISSIVKTGTAGLIDTYTITFTDGSTAEFTVTNGAEGKQGETGPAGEVVHGNLTEAFDDTAAYAVGDYVWYSGQLYKFTAAHAAGAWDETEVEAAALADDVSHLNRHLSDLDTDKQDKTTYQNVTGTTLTLNPAVDNTMYLCGELTELTVTAPATGIFAVRFTSGTTPTVATFTGVTWLNGFDPSSLEANKTYEINILNGLGVAAWT